MGSRLGLAFLLATAIACESFGGDEGVQAGGGDAGVGGDATTASDGGAPGEGGGTTGFCAVHTNVTFCDDFDDGERLDLRWDTVNGTPPVELDRSMSSSSPWSAKMAIPALVLGKSAETDLVRNFAQPSTPKQVHFEAAARFDAIDEGRTIWLPQLTFGGGDYSTRYKVWLISQNGLPYISQEGPEVDGGSAPNTKAKLTRTAKSGTWAHLAIDLDFDTRKITVQLDGSSALAPADMLPEAFSGPVQLAVGIAYVDGPIAPTEVHYDDVLLDLK